MNFIEAKLVLVKQRAIEAICPLVVRLRFPKPFARRMIRVRWFVTNLNACHDVVTCGEQLGALRRHFNRVNIAVVLRRNHGIIVSGKYVHVNSNTTSQSAISTKTVTTQMTDIDSFRFAGGRITAESRRVCSIFGLRSYAGPALPTGPVL